GVSRMRGSGGARRQKDGDEFLSPSVGIRQRAPRRRHARVTQHAYLEPVSGNTRTSLPFPKTEIGKKRAETGARKPRPKDRNPGSCRLETSACRLNPRECGRFPVHKIHRTAWLGREDSNLRVAESKTP